MGRSPDANVKKINLQHALEWDRKGLLHRHFGSPVLKDTIAVPNNGYVVLRFRASNPGMAATDFPLRFQFHFSFPRRLLALPLSFPVPHIDRNEFSFPHRNKGRSAASASELPAMRTSLASNQAPATIPRLMLVNKLYRLSYV